MHTLHVDLGKEMRGGQRQVLLLLQGLREQGIGCQLLAHPAGTLLQEARRQGFLCQAFTFWQLRKLSRRVALVHAHDAKAHSWCAVLARVPLIVSRRVLFAPRNSAISRWKYKQATYYLAISQAVARSLTEYGVLPSRVGVVPDGVPIPPQTARGDLVVALPSADPGKCQTLMEAAARAAGVSLTWAQPLETELAQARLFLYLSQSEGLGSAALLAMAYGVPVVASRVGGLQEAVLDGKTGVLVENDVANVAAALRGVLADEPRRQAMAVQARQHACTYYAAERMVNGTLQAYHKVLTTC